MNHYDATGYCSPCDRHYGQHNPGCSLEGVVPQCMKPLSERNDDEWGF